MPSGDKKPKGIRDIRFPKQETAKSAPKRIAPVPHVQDIPRLPAKPEPQIPPTKKPGLRLAISVFLCIAILGGLVGFSSWYRTLPAKEKASQQGFNTAALREQLSSYWDAIRGGAGSIGGASSGLMRLLGGAGDLAALPKLFLEGNGDEVIAKLTSLRDALRSIEGSLGKVGLEGGGGLGAIMHLVRGGEALDAALAWLSPDASRHFIVIFGNTSELRPGGGFIGSFADLEVRHGALAGLTVHDINEVDRTIDADIVPPEPLQAIARRWRTADANWFFDYPASARKIQAFFERSDFYNGKQVDGVIAITPSVVRDLLEVTGPVTLADGTEITPENFLAEIQADVQEGQAEGSAAPKRVLAELAVPLKDKLAALPEAQFTALFKKAGGWVAEKDLMIYVTDDTLAKTLAAYRADGALYPVPPDFRGDYLAAVTANIGGGKSDFVMRGTTSLESRIAADGTVRSHLTVARTHGAEKDHAWWYRLPNESYLKVFTPVGAVPTAFEGGFRKWITPKANYRAGNFENDKDVVAIESTLTRAEGLPELAELREAGRNVFAAWVTTPPEKTSTVTLDYFRNLGHPLTDGDVYTFVYESQAGAVMGFDLTLTAPEGFAWIEADGPLYTYKNDNPPGRLTVDLTLRRI